MNKKYNCPICQEPFIYLAPEDEQGTVNIEQSRKCSYILGKRCNVKIRNTSICHHLFHRCLWKQFVSMRSDPWIQL